MRAACDEALVSSAAVLRIEALELPLRWGLQRVEFVLGLCIKILNSRLK